MNFENVFVTSDPHFGHANIVNKRPFTSVQEMDNALVTNWNAVVGEKDLVIVNGDFMWSKRDEGVFNSLKGKKVLVKGNHDHSATFNLGWEAVHDYFEFRRFDRDFVFFHYPIENWNKMQKGSVHLYGHVHQNSERKILNRYNVCVEVTSYTPVNLRYYA